MLHTMHRLGRISALVILGSASVLSAEDADGLDCFVKVHGQLGLKAEEGQRGAVGVGGGLNVPMGSGALGLELSITLVPGSTIQETIPDNAFQSTPANSSLTSKHNTTQLALRTTFVQPMATAWSWQMGLGILYSKDTLDSVGNFSVPRENGVGTWTTSTSTSGLVFQPLLGAVWQCSATGTLEFNLVDTMSNKRQEAQPIYTQYPITLPRQYVTPYYTTSTGNDVRLEIVYGYRF